MDISLIMVTYNSAELITSALENIFANLPGELTCEVIVVDNASGDETVKLIAGNFPQVKLITQSKNLGFGSGCNRGAKIARGKALFFVNPDLLISKNSIILLYNYLMAHPNAGVLSPWMVEREGKPNYTARSFPGRSIFISHSRSPVRSFFPALAKGYISILTPPKNALEVDWVIGAAMMVRRSLFEELGGFDERYFMYLEDTDLCWRAKELGYSNYLMGNVTLTHYGKCSTWRVPYAMALAHHRSLNRFLQKTGQLGSFDQLWFTPLLWLNLISSWGYQLFKYRILP
jgi:GT2 family glycosyltransferase